jgi:hypothetical protein
VTPLLVVGPELPTGLPGLFVRDGQEAECVRCGARWPLPLVDVGSLRHAAGCETRERIEKMVEGGGAVLVWDLEEAVH